MHNGLRYTQRSDKRYCAHLTNVIIHPSSQQHSFQWVTNLLLLEVTELFIERKRVRLEPDAKEATRPDEFTPIHRGEDDTFQGPTP